MVANRIARPACEFNRAFRELVGIPPTGPEPPMTPCSPETPEARDYPAPPAGAGKFVLCNGHLSDLFDARNRAARPIVRVGAT